MELPSPTPNQNERTDERRTTSLLELLITAKNTASHHRWGEQIKNNFLVISSLSESVKTHINTFSRSIKVTRQFPRYPARHLMLSSMTEYMSLYNRRLTPPPSCSQAGLLSGKNISFQLKPVHHSYQSE